MRNIKTREGFEFWDKLNALPRYAFLLSPSGKSVQKLEDQAMGNWIDVHEAQKVVDQAQDLINELQQRLTEADERQEQAVTALNEIARVSRMGEKPFEIATMAIGEMSAGIERPTPIAEVPDGYCIMPRQLTAENGAKALLLGEFKLLVTKECPECCELEEPVEGCSICDGEGEYGQKHTIPWDQIKFIYSKAVSGLAVKAESAKSR